MCWRRVDPGAGMYAVGRWIISYSVGFAVYLVNGKWCPMDMTSVGWWSASGTTGFTGYSVQETGGGEQ